MYANQQQRTRQPLLPTGKRARGEEPNNAASILPQPQKRCKRNSFSFQDIPAHAPQQIGRSNDLTDGEVQRCDAVQKYDIKTKAAEQNALAAFKKQQGLSHLTLTWIPKLNEIDQYIQDVMRVLDDAFSAIS